MVISKNDLMINEEIRDKDVRLIDADGSMLGIVATKEAQKLAASKNLDLVKIAPQAVPPVCRIMDYGKYMFELQKKEKEARKNQKVINVKEVWLKPTIEDHDFDFKAKNAYKFLKDGDKVKVTVKFRGREMNYTSLGLKVLEKFAETVSEVGTMEKRPRLEGKSMTMFLNPLKEKETLKDKAKNREKAPAGARTEPPAKKTAPVPAGASSAAPDNSPNNGK